MQTVQENENPGMSIRAFTRERIAVTSVLILASVLLSGCGGSSATENVAHDQIVNPNETTATTLPIPETPVVVDDTAPATTNDNTSGYNLGATLQSVVDQCMSDAEKEMLTLVNNNRETAQYCGDNLYPSTHTLSWHCTLATVADQHNRDMGDHNFFSHTGSDGLRSSDRVTNAGYSWSAVGENIAAGQSTVQDVMDGWMDSPGHCSNIMSASYSQMGAASYQVSGSDYPVYWTQNFASPRN